MELLQCNGYLFLISEDINLIQRERNLRAQLSNLLHLRKLGRKFQIDGKVVEVPIVVVETFPHT